MGVLRKLALAAGGLLTVWVAWGVVSSRTTDRVSYLTLDRIDGIEIRRYPQTVLVETTAPNSVTAFRRLFRYLKGANERSESVSMTAPVSITGDVTGAIPPVPVPGGTGESISMTAPVQTGRDGNGVRMAFYLPQEYTAESAPTPTDPAVRLVVEPQQTVAVRRFSWYASPGRVERERQRLFEFLERSDFIPRGEPYVLQYDDPWTPPFMRTNEIAVPIER